MRCRIITPSFFECPELAELGSDGMILFAGLWCMADREGRLKDIPKLIQSKVFPYNEKVNINKILEKMDGEFIIRYTAPEDCVSYIQIINFRKYQHVHPHEAKSQIPPYSGHEFPKSMSNKASGNVITTPDNVMKCQSASTSTSTSTSTISPAPENGAGLFLKLPLQDGTEYEISKFDLDSWKKLYPYLDVEQSFRSMLGWLVSHPQNQKTHRGMPRFINGWLDRDQNNPKVQKNLPGAVSEWEYQQ